MQLQTLNFWCFTKWIGVVCILISFSDRSLASCGDYTKSRAMSENMSGIMSSHFFVDDFQSDNNSSPADTDHMCHGPNCSRSNREAIAIEITDYRLVIRDMSPVYESNNLDHFLSRFLTISDQHLPGYSSCLRLFRPPRY